MVVHLRIAGPHPPPNFGPRPLASPRIVGPLLPRAPPPNLA